LNGSTPLTISLVSQSEAVQLFVARAQPLAATFALTQNNARTIAHICERLDGIPLALELAAARIKSLSVEQIAARLDDRFRLLTGGSRTALPRQQTLRAAIDWSFSLLTEEERVLLRRLSVFAGGWSLEAAESVCSKPKAESTGMLPTADCFLLSDVLDLLARLVDRSLVVFEQHGGETRYRLMETIRQYAREKLLDSGEGDQIRARHLDFFIKLVEEAEPKLDGAEVKQWMGRLETEYDNLRAAWEQAIATDHKLALRLALPLYLFWTMHAHLVEGREWLAQLLPHTEAWGESIQRAKALFLVGSLDFSLGDYSSARSFGEQGLTIARNLGDLGEVANGLRLVGRSYYFLKEYEKARPLFEESLALYRSWGDQGNIARLLFGLGSTIAEQGNPTQAQPLVEESIALFRALHNELLVVAPLNMLGEIVRAQGDYARAAEIYAETVEIDRRLGNEIHLPNALSNLGMAVLQQGNYRRAGELFSESLDWIRRRGTRVFATMWLTGMAGVIEANGQPIPAARLLGVVNALAESSRSRGSADTLADRQFHRDVLDKVRGRLDLEAFNQAWKEGSVMTLEQAIECALENVK
jgi:tetratricopeptide (TPR) repeat protein